MCKSHFGVLLVALIACTCRAELKCSPGSEGYWALDAPNNECAEACLSTVVQRSFWWVVTGGQGHPAGNESSPCADNGFHKFDRTDVIGQGPISISLDKFLPDSTVQLAQPNNSKCALACTASAIGVYWACAAECIKKEGSDNCITEKCLADVAAYDVKCLTGCNSSKAPVAIADSTTPCCDGDCELPLVKYFSTDAPHGFCGEACMDPAKFDIYHKFEANLTRATGDHPCSKQYTPDNSKQYTDYFSTVTHGFPGVLTVTLDLYAPQDMPDHSCCYGLLPVLGCFDVSGPAPSMTIFGTGPYCCPSTATEAAPCPAKDSAVVVI